MANDRPYAHAPLALALIEFRHPTTRSLTRGELEALKQGLIKDTPLLRSEEVMNFAFSFGGPVQQPAPVTIHRFQSRDSRTSLVVRPEAIAFETTNYQGWTAFRDFVQRGLQLRQDLVPLDGIDRIGLRFIDEIRPRDTSQGATDWSLWVQPSMLAPIFEQGTGLVEVQQQQCTVQYSLERPEQTLALRYGAVDGPSVVQPNDPRSMGNPAVLSSPHFLIDTDAAWTLPAGGTLPEFEVEPLLDLADQLQRPSKAVFEAAITDYARGEFNRD